MVKPLQNVIAEPLFKNQEVSLHDLSLFIIFVIKGRHYNASHCWARLLSWLLFFCDGLKMTWNCRTSQGIGWLWLLFEPFQISLLRCVGGRGRGNSMFPNESNGYLLLSNEEGTLSPRWTNSPSLGTWFSVNWKENFLSFKLIVNVMLSLRHGPKDTGYFLWNYRIWKNLTWSLEGPQGWARPKKYLKQGCSTFPSGLHPPPFFLAF